MECEAVLSDQRVTQETGTTRGKSAEQPVAININVKTESLPHPVVHNGFCRRLAHRLQDAVDGHVERTRS